MHYIEICDIEILKLIVRNIFLINDKYIKKRINKIVIKNLIFLQCINITSLRTKKPNVNLSLVDTIFLFSMLHILCFY